MAERRMFAKTIIDSDAFLDMPLSSQALYFHLNMRADDDGFVNNPKKISRMIGASDDDLKLLMVKAFIIPFENGVVVIKHWRINNYIRSDRYKETVYKEERGMLDLKENGAYTTNDNFGIPDGYQTETQYRLGKDNIDKNNTYGDFSNSPSVNDKQSDEDIFEQLWKLYPKKLGKGSVSKTQKHRIAKIGVEEMTRAIERYISSIQGKEMRYVLYGSTFFNSGYVDFIDENYEEQSTLSNKGTGLSDADKEAFLNG